MFIDSKISLGSPLKQYSQDVLKNELMFFNADAEFCLGLSIGPTYDFLMALESHGVNLNSVIIDSRIHMLMPGWYPCIPGFHHDDVPRERSDKQPEYHNPSYRSKHALVLFNGDICPTEFAIGGCEFTDPNNHDTIYKEWHKEVINNINNGNLQSVFAPSNQIVFFDDRTWHQGTKSTGNGWRLFIRASWDTKRTPTNEIRNQVQVYMDNPHMGW